MDRFRCIVEEDAEFGLYRIDLFLPCCSFFFRQLSALFLKAFIYLLFQSAYNIPRLISLESVGDLSKSFTSIFDDATTNLAGS